MKTFQRPLSSEEEASYIRVLKEGNSEEVSEAKEILIERNLRLVAHIAKKYQNVDEDMEDLISIGTIGLIKAVGSFDTSKGSRLATYAARCIDNELLMLLRSKKENFREVSLYEPIGTDKEGNEINLLDVIEQEQEEVIDRIELDDNIKKLSELVERVLDEREKEIIRLRYGLLNGKEITQREIGQQLGISRSYVSRIEKRALLKLRAGVFLTETKKTQGQEDRKRTKKMHFVKTEELKSGMRLASAIYDKQGEILYQRDSKLTSQEIMNIQNLGLIGIFVLESAEPAPPMTQEEVESERFQAMTVFSIQEELESIVKNTKAQKTDNIVSGIIKQYGHLENKITFYQSPRSKEDYIFKHILNTAILCAIITNRMNLKVEERLETVTAAVVHDVGKLELEAHIINKSELSESEAGLVHFKVVEGFEMIKQVYSNGSVIRRICEQAENALYSFRQGEFDRKQFEKSTQKYIGTRVLIVAEVFDTMTAMKAEKAPESGVKAIKYLRDHSDIFDSRVVDALSDSLNILSAGVSVELNTGDKALVITENERNILRPMILCFKDNTMMDLSNREFDDIEIIDIAKTMDNRHFMDRGNGTKTGE